MHNLLWIDMEMTGLDVNKEVIIEVAAIVTDLNFKEITQYHAVVKQDQRYIDAMDDWNSKHHRESGLVQQIPSGRSPDVVEKDLLDIVDYYFAGDKVVLAGNSIGQDRLFINKYFTKLADKLHYRMLDVTAWKIMFASKYNVNYKKQKAHRAVDDIRESIGELQHYISFIDEKKLK